VIGREHFIARLQGQRARDNIHAKRRVWHKNDLFGLCANIGGKRFARFGQQAIEPAAQKFDRIGLKLALPLLIGLENRTGTGTETAMIEKCDIRADLKLFRRDREDAPGAHVELSFFP
jgi:hypothetical protein